MRPVGRALAVVVALLFVVGLAAAGAAPEGTVELTLSDPAIIESSGLVARGDLVMTVNDSGDTGRVFAVDRDSGDTVGVTTWSDDPTDVEAVAPAGGRFPDDVWVADIGDNPEARDSVSVVRVPVGRGDRDVRGEVASYELVYPGGPLDAETLMVEPASGRLVIVTKGIFGGDVLLAPARLDPDGPNRMRVIGSARAIATDGAFWPDGRHLVVRGYSTAVVYTWPGLDVVDRFDLPDQQQGEGIAIDGDGVVLISSEGADSDVLRVRLPKQIARTVAPLPRPTTTRSPMPSPPASTPATPATVPDVDLTPSDEIADGSVRPFVIGGLAVLVMLGLLVRSLRPRG